MVFFSFFFFRYYTYYVCFNYRSTSIQLKTFRVVKGHYNHSNLSQRQFYQDKFLVIKTVSYPLYRKSTEPWLNRLWLWIVQSLEHTTTFPREPLVLGDLFWILTNTEFQEKYTKPSVVLRAVLGLQLTVADVKSARKSNILRG